MNRYHPPALLFLYLLLFQGGCSPQEDPCHLRFRPDEHSRETIREALAEAESGCRISFREGVYEFTSGLRMEDKSDVTLEGAGRGQTVFSFAGQQEGEEGLLITRSRDMVVKNFTIRDSGGDALKFRNSRRIVISGMGAEWSGAPSVENGEYGYYPVASRDILIDDSYAYGASDAGIYVGLSERAVIRNSTAEANVIGIEVTNAREVDIIGNTALDNTAGIILSNLPGLPGSSSRLRIIENRVLYNDQGNFAHEDETASEVPSGTGILLLGAKEAEITGNTVSGNNVLGTAVASYSAFVILDRFPEPDEDGFDPHATGVYIHGNTYRNDGTYPETGRQSFFGKLIVQTFSPRPVPDIVLDGIFAPGSGPSGAICVNDNAGDRLVNLNLSRDFPANLNFDPSPHACHRDPLPPVSLDIPPY